MKWNFLLVVLAIPTTPILADDLKSPERSADVIFKLKIDQQPTYLIPGVNQELLNKMKVNDNTIINIKKLSDLTILTKGQRIEALEFEYTQKELKDIGAPISEEEKYLFSSSILRGTPLDNLLTRKLGDLENLYPQKNDGLSFLEQTGPARKELLIKNGFSTEGLEMSIGAKEGSKALTELYPYHQELIPNLNLETADCQGGMDDFNGKLGKKTMDCFVGLDASKYKISSYNPDRKTYLRGLYLLGSIVDQQGRHLCMASVYKKGVWITAKHCLDGKKSKLANYLKTAENTTRIESVRFCKNCDVAFIDLSTPNLKETDLPKIDTPAIMKDPIFMPGIALHENLSEISKQQDMDLKYIWSEYGKGYCKAIKIFSNGCMVHGCSAVPGFSGAPMYTYKNDQLQLVGILSGADGTKNSCSYLGSINYSLALKTREDIL